uniref:L1 transposable element RRM domain-containing protein n=1 Tax=Poecilia formosa TaxID=48698 RepID=A0A087YPS9_POEFO
VYSPDFKAELLTALREEMAGIFKTQLETALTNNLIQIKLELHGVKTELSASITAIRSEVDALKVTVAEMDGPLSSCTDDVVSLKSDLDRLSAQVLVLDRKCEDLESRSRRNNIRIIGLPEERGPVSADTISTLLKDAFGLEKEPVVDRVHRSLQAKPKPGQRPRPIIARLHYYSDCADILRRARAQQRVKVGDSTVSIFPDFTPQTAKARAAFNDVRRQLRDVPDIRFGLLHPARLRITRGGVTREFTSPVEATAFMKTL